MFDSPPRAFTHTHVNGSLVFQTQRADGPTGERASEQEENQKTESILSHFTLLGEGHILSKISTAECEKQTPISSSHAAVAPGAIVHGSRSTPQHPITD
jgi:hypothetical protein